ncbi:hypothetical protein [Streptomyces tendae]|uniref:hypothetical protein n=1 Tax=Streptomyces tendae TaxID=1932 RepID=UPI0034377439
MTWGRRARLTLYTVAFAVLCWNAAATFVAGVWPLATALYAMALVLAGLAYADWSASVEFDDAVDARLPTRPTSRAHARRLARRVLAGACRCDRWWTSLGTDHDPWCPVQTGEPRRARLPHPRTRRRTVGTARRHRRHRPR